MFKQPHIMIIVLVALASSACGPIAPATQTVTAIPNAGATVLPGDKPTATLEIDTNKQAEMAKWDLWASGETQLRGVNIYQRPVYPEWDGSDWMGPGPVGPPYVQEDFDEMSAAGLNYVNISHPGLFTEKPPYEPDEGIQANLDSLLAMIRKADLFAVISLRTGPGRSEFSFMGVTEEDEFGQHHLNDTVWEDQAAQDAWAAMWRHMAERYKDNSVVVGYDLMVEPNANAIFFDIYWPPDFYPAYADTLYDWNWFYPSVVEAVREVDPNTPILVGAMSWSSPDWLPYLEPISDPCTVYTFHQYMPHDYTHQEPDELGNLPITYPGRLDLNWDGVPDPFDRAWLESSLSTVDEFRTEHNLPVATNEYGAQRYEPGAVQYLDDEMSLFEELGINYALWSWSSAYWMQREESKSFEFRLGADPNNRTEIVPNEMWDVLTGYWVRNTLRPSGVKFVSAGR